MPISLSEEPDLVSLTPMHSSRTGNLLTKINENDVLTHSFSISTPDIQNKLAYNTKIITHD